MQTRKDDFIETLTVLYHVEESFVGKVRSFSSGNQPKITLKNICGYFANPNHSVLMIAAPTIAEWTYANGSQYFALDKITRRIALHPKCMATSTKYFGYLTNKIANHTPNFIRPYFPIHTLASDVTLLAGKAQEALATGQKIKACMTRTGIIAKETIVADIGQSIKKTVHNAIKPTPATKSAAPAPQSTRPASSWSASAWNALSNVAALAKSLTVEATAIGASNGASFLTTHYADKVINKCVAELNSQIEKKEYEYLDNVSKIVVDPIAKIALTYTIGIGASMGTATYLIPNITKWGLNFVVDAPTAELITTGVTCIAYGLTLMGIDSTINQYHVNRQQTAEALSQLHIGEAANTLKTTLVKTMTKKMNTVLSSAENRFTLFSSNKFIARCKKELPATFERGSP